MLYQRSIRSHNDRKKVRESNNIEMTVAAVSDAKIKKDYSLHLTIMWYELFKKSDCWSLSRVYEICGTCRRPYEYEDPKTCKMIVGSVASSLYLYDLGLEKTYRLENTVQ